MSQELSVETHYYKMYYLPYWYRGKQCLQSIMKDKRKFRRYLKKGKLVVTWVPFYFRKPAELDLPTFENNTKEVVAQSCNIKTCLDAFKEINLGKQETEYIGTYMSKKRIF